MNTMDQIINALPNFGLAGFAIFIMWRMYESNAAERDKHNTSSALEREKHLTLLNEAHKEFGLFQEKVRTEIMGQLGQVTNQQQKNTSAFEKVLEHFSKH